MTLVATASGSRIALVEPAQIVVLELPQLEPIAEIAIEGDLDVAFAGDRRLAILQRGADGTRMHVVDAHGPTKIGEVAFRAPARIAAVAGSYVLAVGATAAMIDLSRDDVAAVPLPLRNAATAAAAFDGARFIIATGGVLEEWDAATRSPARRVRLDPPQACAYVGGNAQRLWMIPSRDPDYLDVISMTARSSRRIDLPERPAAVAAHAGGSLVAVIGATTSAAYTIDLDAPEPVVRVDRRAITGLAWLGTSRVLAVRPVGAPVDLVTIPLLEKARRVLTFDGDAPVVEAPEARDAVEPAKPEVKPEVVPEPAPAPATVPDATPRPTPRDAHGGWRLEAATWAATVRDGKPPPSIAERPRLLVTRLGLGDDHARAVALLYGARLAGIAMSAVEVARALAWRWDEVVGAAGFAAALRWRGDRVELAGEVVAFLDERPAKWGTELRAQHVRDDTVAVVAPDDIPLERVGAWATWRAGSLLVASSGGEVFRDRCAFEARIRGLAPLVRGAVYTARELPRPGVIVVPDAARAAALELRVVATWPVDQSIAK